MILKYKLLYKLVLEELEKNEKYCWKQIYNDTAYCVSSIVINIMNEKEKDIFEIIESSIYKYF